MRFRHVNLIARDWEALARFYCAALGCTPVLPHRDQRGEWLDRLTGIDGAHLRGVHLRLPGGGEDGPTLEIFTYDSTRPADPAGPDHPGFAHIAFEVNDVMAAVNAVVAQGGRLVGEVVHTTVSGVGRLSCAYARDPEGNIVELQHWAAATDTAAAPRGGTLTAN